MARHASSAADGPSLIAAQVMLLAAWLGASLLFTAVVAPAAFAVLPSRELAGSLVGRVLPVLFWAGACTGLSLVVLHLRAGEQRFRATRVGAASVLTAACLVAQLAIAPRISALRAAMAVPLAGLPAGDPQRIMFGRLHMFSVAWLGVAILAAVVALAFALITLRSRTRP